MNPVKFQESNSGTLEGFLKPGLRRRSILKLHIITETILPALINIQLLTQIKNL